jgi:hypothetical protein
MNWAPGEVPEFAAPHDHRHHEKPDKRRAAVTVLR